MALSQTRYKKYYIVTIEKNRKSVSNSSIRYHIIRYQPKNVRFYFKKLKFGAFKVEMQDNYREQINLVLDLKMKKIKQ